jgi:hypothetical protein
MSELGTRKSAYQKNPLGPVAGSGPHQALNVVRLFAIGVAGDTAVITTTAGAHVLMGDSGVVADTTSPFFLGCVRLALPNGCTHVSMIQGADPSAGCAYKG